MEEKRNEDLFEIATKRKQQTEEKTNDFFRKNKNYIILSLLILVLGIGSFLTIAFIYGFTKEFFINLIIMLITNSVALSFFIPQGKESETKFNNSFKQNAGEWSALSYNVQTDLSREFMDFCKDYTEEKRQDKIHTYIRNAGIDVKEYEDNIKKLCSTELKAYLKQKDKYGNDLFTNNQKRLIKKSKGKIRVKTVDPTIVLLGSSANDKYEVGQAKIITADKKLFANRLLKVIVFSFLLATISISALENVDILVAVGLFALRLCSIVVSATAGFYAGVSSIQERNDFIKKNILFLKLFIKEQEKKRIKVEEIVK